ncbi:MAG TPA: hypothetical protein PLF59_08160 [Cyclobacteriaceae bacterium]|nr:hypothetical protein [Cyclobacteriaceae bacterium]
MAGLWDVADTLAGLVEQAVYPAGTSQPSVAGVDVTIFVGWPVREVLDDTLKAGKAMVSIYPTDKERYVTKFERVFQTVSISPATLTAIVSGNTVTIGGVVSVPQAVMVILNAVGYSYGVLITDTLDTIAAALAAMIPGASSTGQVITLTNVTRLSTSIMTQATAAQELTRQERVFQISCWTTTPDIRRLLDEPIDVYLKKVVNPVFSDGFYGLMWYDHRKEIDATELQLIYRTDLFFRVQYATTDTQQFTTIGTVDETQTVTQGGF